jgi:NAD(P)-dependent dehydrogenase (short-subunit alcohol dehydrogenase family)
MAVAPGQGFLAHREPGGVLHTYVALSKPQEWIAGLDFARPATATAQVAAEFDGWAPELTALAAHPGDVEAALAQYEEALFPRSAEFAAESDRNHKLMFAGNAPTACSNCSPARNWPSERPAPCVPRHTSALTDKSVLTAATVFAAPAGLDSDTIAISPGEHPMPDLNPDLNPEPIQTAVVTGASRGFGRAIAAALLAQGIGVVGIARGAQELHAAADELGAAFTPLAGDATGEELARDVIARYRPGLLVLNAGVIPHMAPLPDQTWETFSRNWHADTRHVFAWTQAALAAPLAPGSVVVAMSSGAALAGSPLSGGYASAKAAIRYIRGYAADESQRAGLGIRFVALLPQLTPATGLGSAGVDGYAARQGVDRDTFVAGLAPVLTPEQVAEAVVKLAADPGSGPEYLVNGAGLRPVG